MTWKTTSHRNGQCPNCRAFADVYVSGESACVAVQTTVRRQTLRAALAAIRGGHHIPRQVTTLFLPLIALPFDGQIPLDKQEIRKKNTNYTINKERTNATIEWLNRRAIAGLIAILFPILLAIVYAKSSMWASHLECKQR